MRNLKIPSGFCYLKTSAHQNGQQNQAATSDKQITEQTEKIKQLELTITELQGKLNASNGNSTSAGFPGKASYSGFGAQGTAQGKSCLNFFSNSFN